MHRVLWPSQSGLERCVAKELEQNKEEVFEGHRAARWLLSREHLGCSVEKQPCGCSVEMSSNSNQREPKEA